MAAGQHGSENYETLLIERPEPGIVVLRLNRPDRLNALVPATVREIHHAFETLAKDETCRVVVLTGAGRGFCAGMDIKASVQRQGDAGYGVVRKMQSQEAFAGMVQRMRAMPQVVIAAVNGPAAGAGFGLALAAEMRIAATSAQFLVASVRIGLTAGECGISYHLPRLIGTARAFEVMLTGRPIESDEAERCGLVSKVVADDELMPSALNLARAVLANSPFSIRQTKQMIWTNLEAPSLDAALAVENRAQILATFTDDFKEATRAFSEKRAPNFTGS